MKKGPELRYSMVRLSYLCLCISRTDTSETLNPVFHWFPPQAPSKSHRHSIDGASTFYQYQQLLCYLKLMGWMGPCIWFCSPALSGRKRMKDLASHIPPAPELKSINSHPKEESKLRRRSRKILQKEAWSFNNWSFQAFPGKFQPPTQHPSCFSFLYPHGIRLQMTIQSPGLSSFKPACSVHFSLS